MHALLAPSIARAGSQTQAIQSGRDLLVDELTGHVPDNFDRFDAGTTRMFAGPVLLDPQLRMSAACPMDQQDDFVAVGLHICDDFLNQNPDDSLF